MTKKVNNFSAKELGRHYGNAMENSIQRNEAEGEIRRRELRNSNIQTSAIVITCVIALATLIVTMFVD